jgi:ligand-binding SRPBCC domain-containing protein
VARRVLTFTSTLAATPARVWDWASSVGGISRELWPLLRMTVPRHVKNLHDVRVEPGRPLFRSWVFLFGLLPIDRSDLTMLELRAGRGFVEESPMLSMHLWRHRRTLAADGAHTTLTDELTFEPRFAPPLVAWFIRTVFTHRHAVLRAHFGSVARAD